jgi:hypothetical protein
MRSSRPEPEPAAWLAAATGDDPADVAAALELGARRRAFVADELLEAGFRDRELHDLVMRLTGVDSAEANRLVSARVHLVEPPPGSVPSRDWRLAENETLFRRVNERRFQAETADAVPEWLEIVCECADRGCRRALTLPTAEYEWLRQNLSRFAVLPGHETPAVENVVERFPGYLIVERAVARAQGR